MEPPSPPGDLSSAELTASQLQPLWFVALALGLLVSRVTRGSHLVLSYPAGSPQPADVFQGPPPRRSFPQYTRASQILRAQLQSAAVE